MIVKSDPFSLLSILRDRCPGLQWPSGRVTQLLADFPECDQHAAVVGTCDWINHGQSGRVKDGVGVLRGRLERQRAALPDPAVLSHLNGVLASYDNFN